MHEDTIKPVRLTLKELVEHYEGFLQVCERKSFQTYGTYKRALREFLKWFPIDKRFRFTVRDVERYKRHLIERKNLQDVSVATYMTALRRFCQYLIDIRILDANPAGKVIGGRRPANHSREFLTYYEIGQLFDAVNRTTLQGMRDYAIMAAMLGCALSIHECLHADIGDIQRKSTTGTIRVQGKGRTAKDTSVRIPPETLLAIDTYLERRFGDSKPDVTSPLFISQSNRTMGKRMTARGIREAINRWLRESGVKRERDRQLTPFSLRHTAGVVMVDEGATVEEVMERMRIEWRPTAQLYFKMRGKLAD